MRNDLQITAGHFVGDVKKLIYVKENLLKVIEAKYA